MDFHNTFKSVHSYADIFTIYDQVNWRSVVFTLISLFIVSRAIKYYNAKKAVNHLPGLTVAFEALALPAVLLPSSLSLNVSIDLPWICRFNLYKKCKAETISILPFLTGKPTIYTSNLDVARQVVAGGVKSDWIKPAAASRALLLFGMNLAAADRDTWRRHRRVMGPAFNNKTHTLVWDCTVRTYKDMIATEGWSDTSRTVFDEPKVQRLTFKLALLVIGICGFGFDTFSWNDPPKDESGDMSVQQSLKIVTDTNLVAIFMPKWFRDLPIGWLREIRKAHQTLTTFMHAQVEDRRKEARSGAPPRDDVFSMIIRANEEDGGKYPLDDTEVIGNVFLLLFAGHETTAHTLAATLGLLALHQDIQNEILQHILDVIGPTREPTYEDYDALYKVLAAFHEALRMYPTAFIMIREATEDTILTIPKPAGEEGSTAWPIQKGQRVIVDMIGLEYNTRYFPEPEKFIPARWYAGGATLPEAEFSAFSIGPRQCLGRKFATTEAVAFLTLLLRDWKVEPLLNDGETNEQWKDRVMQVTIMMTLGIRNVPIRFTRRTAKV